MSGTISTTSGGFQVAMDGNFWFSSLFVYVYITGMLTELFRRYNRMCRHCSICWVLIRTFDSKAILVCFVNQALIRFSRPISGMHRQDFTGNNMLQILHQLTS